MVLGPPPTQWNPLVSAPAGELTGSGAGGGSAGSGSGAGGGSTQPVGVVASDAAVVAAGVLPSAFVEQPDLTMSLNRDLLQSAKLTSTSPPTVVYRINPRAVWSDGAPITWQDFAYNWQAQSGKSRFRDAGNRPYRPSTTAGYTDIASVSPTGGNPNVVTVTFTVFYPDWRSLFSDMVPAHVASRVGFDTGFTDPVDDLVSGGPFMVENYQPGASLTLVRNARWWGAPATLSSVTFDFVSHSSVAATALDRSEVGGVYLPPSASLTAALKSVSSVNVDSAGSSIWEELEFDQANPWLKSLAVRQAIMEAIDRPQLIAATVGGIDPNLSPLDSRIWLPNQPGYTATYGKRYDHSDVGTATGLLSKAGFVLSGGTLSLGGRPVTLRLSAQPSRLHTAVEAFMVKALAQIGISVQVTGTPPAAGHPDSYDLAIVDRQASPALASVDAEIGSPATVGTANYSGADDPAVDQLLAQANATANQATRVRLYQRADADLWQAAESLPLFQVPTAVAFDARDLGIAAGPAAAGPAWDISAWAVPYQS
jgi:peptide/nickel transport system substrate-binding protein